MTVPFPTSHLWWWVQDHLGLAEVIRSQQRQERTMARLSDELADLARRQQAIHDSVTTSNTNVRAALDRMSEEIAALRDGELSDEQQQRVDAIKAQADEIQAAVASMDDGYEPPVVEPAPVPGVEGQPEPGTPADQDRSGI